MNMKYEEFSHLDVYVLCQLLFSSMILASEYDGLSPLWFASLTLVQKNSSMNLT